MDPTIDEELLRWRATPLQEGDIPFEEAVNSLGSPDSPIEVRQVSPSRWTVFQTGTSDAAVFSYTLLFSKSDDYFTGNLGDPLIRGQPAPVEEVSGDRIERYTNFRCNYAYAFDTFHDKSVWGIIQTLETYVSTRLKHFNHEPGVPRREYDSPWDASRTRKLWMRAPMFVRVKRGERKGPPPSHLHPRVINADKRATVYSASPARPVVYTYDEATDAFAEVRESGVLVAGDIVVVAFTASFVVGSAQWFTEFIPAEIVRVSSEPAEVASTVDFGAPPLVTRRRLDQPNAIQSFDDPTPEDGTLAQDVTLRDDRASADLEDTPIVPSRPGRSASLTSISGIARSVAAMEVNDSRSPAVPGQPASEDDDMSDFVFPDPPGTEGLSMPPSSVVHPSTSRGGLPKIDSEDTQSPESSPSPRGVGTKRKRPGGLASENSSTGSSAFTDDEDSGHIGARRTRQTATRVRR